MKEFTSSFVSASAGSGKTKALIDRLLYLLLNNVQPNKILCLSFTKAAAAEIIDRINQKLSFLCICDRESLIEELQQLGFKEISNTEENKARTLFVELIDASDPLKVQTIHAFCQDLLNKFPLEAGIQLGFRILDESEIQNLVEQSKDILLRSKTYQEKIRKYLLYLSWHIKEYSFNELLKEIVSSKEKLDHFFNINEDINFNSDLIDEDTEILEFIKSITINRIHLELLKQGNKTDFNRALALEKFFGSSLEIQILLINDYFDCFLTKSGTPLSSMISKKLEQSYPEILDNLNIEQKRTYNFYKKYNEIKIKNQSTCFIIISYYIREIYQNLKETNNALDYDDLITLSNNLLTNTEYSDWIRYKLDGGIDHVLVDEAQDNSLKQWNIINKIVEEFFQDFNLNKSLFIVGDAKQSIFRFQGAAPEIFNSMNEYLPQTVERIQLNKSYRSGRSVLKLVDNIFNQKNIKPHLTNIEPHIQHIANRDYDGKVEVWPLITLATEKKEKAWLFLTEEDLLAIKIVDQIELWLLNKKFIASKKRPIFPSDILILVRRRNIFVHKLIKILRERSIPVAGLDRLKLLEHPAILDVIALSNFILSPIDDLNLAIILKSPIFNLSEDQLIDLCAYREGTLWESLSQSQKYEEIYNFLNNLDTNFLYEFYFDLIENKFLRQKYISYFGIEVNDIFDSFLDLVEKYSNENSHDLQKFIHYIQNIELEIKRDLSVNANSIRIMTVHSSKGLQAPIVFLADTVSLPFNDDKLIWLENGKLAYAAKSKYYSDDMIQAKITNNAYEYAEYLRLLYVALTRAEDEIIITGSSKTSEISEKCWYSIVKSSAPMHQDF